MEHPAFSEAGQTAGLEIWTIDNFEPVAIERKKYGKFYEGDSYIVLHTNQSATSSFTYNVHFWLGAHTSQDKMGAAAILTVALDDMLGGRAVQHREVQGHESSLFQGYFKPAIRYLPGGLESGFTEVETNAGAPLRLLRLSGCDNMRIEEVPAEAASLHRDQCFILELDHDIFVLMPSSARATQRRRVVAVANKLRDEEHNGRAAIEILDEFSPDEDFDRFFEALGSGSRDEMDDASSEEEFTRDGTTVYLYKVLYGDEFELDALNKPFKQKHLASDEIFILDTPDSGIFIWIGSSADEENKKNYHDIVQKYLDVKGYPAWLHATRVTEGAESSLFKQYFAHWDVNDNAYIKSYASGIDAGYGSGEDDAVVAKLVGKSAAASRYMPDDGSGTFTVFRFAGGEQEDIMETLSSSSSGARVLHAGAVYVVQYQYEGDSYVVYNWVGADSSSEDRAAAAELVTQLEDELEGKTTLVRVPQGKEPKHFLGLFKGHLVIVFGSKENDYAPDNANHDYEDTNVRLFRVEGTALGVDMRATQVPETAASLEDDDVFVLQTADTLYVRVGKESDDTEKTAALEFIESFVTEDGNIVTFDQGDESDEFWEILGGKPDDLEDNSTWKATVSRRAHAATTLTAVSVNMRGKVRFEELPEFAQEDLSDDGVYILDTGEELYFWRGAAAPARVLAAKEDIVEQYISDDGLDRTATSALVVSVRQGAEPAVFRAHFPDWDEDMWTNQTSYEDIKNEVKAGNA
ncbi:gelsolin-like [Plutella xylostella]|uniref:gelsolin-like n=1 Tax=Plutella xylostella TaxID=51655 RepID=UPI002032BF0B|nr:gelsolin-like [Plutella xylostella]